MSWQPWLHSIHTHNCAVYMPESLHVRIEKTLGTDQPQLWAIASVCQNPEPWAWKCGAWKRQKSQNKKNISPILAVRDKSDKFLCMPRILAYTTRHDLGKARSPGFSSASEGLNSLRLPKQCLCRMPINKEFDIQWQQKKIYFMFPEKKYTPWCSYLYNGRQNNDQ